VAGYTVSSGDVLIDTALPIANVTASIDRTTLGYERTFALGGHAANVAVLIPYNAANFSGNVGEQSTAIQRWGFGDVATRFAWNFIGNRALRPVEFMRQKPSTTAGASLLVTAPTGAYNPAHLINASSHRWGFRPEIGAEIPIGKWFVNGAGGVWLFTNNNNFFGGHVRSQNPVWEFQALGGYYFRPGLWLSAGGTYYTGGRTSVDGAANHDVLANGRYGLQLSVPFTSALSAKVFWSNWLTATAGGKFQTVGLSFQYRWFDR